LLISLDIETYSSVDLISCGVYKYVQAHDFEILLLAYAFDDEEVHILDLVVGEEIPTIVLQALSDDRITKSAYNAMFERICISKHLGIHLSPLSWECTAVKAATLSLPASLANVANVLKLEQGKMGEGKDLIKYFCIPCSPTKVNGGRCKNLPCHAPDKWDLFKEYCIRDVEVERNVRKKLLEFKYDEQSLYCLDQKINDTGVSVDMELVENAIAFDALSKDDMLSQAKKLTGLDNPNSVAQLKQWLLDNGLEVDSLSKKTVVELAKENDGDIEELLNLRLRMSKTSTKKYEAIKRSVCDDGRVKGLFQFCGANRTGRWCLTGDHEVLTKNGWKRLDEWNGGEIACWTAKGEMVSFQKAEQVQFDYNGDMYIYSDKRISQISTPDHKMYVKRRYGAPWQTDVVENMQYYRPSIPFTGFRTINSNLEHSQLRVLVMVQADGHYVSDGGIRLKFVKQRKIERCRYLLRKADITYLETEQKAGNKVAAMFTITARHVPLWLRLFREKTFGSWLFDESADVFFDEIVHWDGYQSAKNSIQYCTCNKQNADIVQAFAHISGRSALIRVKCRSEEHPNWSDAYVVDIWLTPKNCHEIRTKPLKYHYSGKVYCAATSTGYFLIRRNGRVWVTGNSGRLVQVQNLPQNHLKDLELARQIVKNGDFNLLEQMYDSVPSVLSELIRTAFIPQEGSRFIVADFSAIEARVIAWFAGEQWRLDVFNSHGKIYEASASAMFHVPIGQIDKTSPLRQKGKIAELALGYGGSVGALKAMGALEMGVAENELKGLVNAWRNANPAIVKFWWDVGNAAELAVTKGKATTIGRIKIGCGKVGGDRYLMCILPSGRRLCYFHPSMQLGKFDRMNVTYEGIGTSKRWGRLDSYGPKFVENIVQATARDLLAEAMIRLDIAGYKIVMHVHDEAVAEAPMGFRSVKEMCDIMAINPVWADGLPLKADGYECKFYKKE